MKPASFLAGLLCGIAASAAAVTSVTVVLVHHDALGRTQTATAQLESLSQDYPAGIVRLTYRSDSLGCSGFEP